MEREERRYLKALRELGLDAVAEIANSPFVVTGGDVDECVAMIRELAPDERRGALDRLRLPRTMVGLRVLRLAAALRLVDDPVVGPTASEVAAAMVAEHETGFADESLEAATHRVEMALSRSLHALLSFLAPTPRSPQHSASNAASIPTSSCGVTGVRSERECHHGSCHSGGGPTDLVRVRAVERGNPGIRGATSARSRGRGRSAAQGRARGRSETPSWTCGWCTIPCCP